jgi:hypothetical protein
MSGDFASIPSLHLHGAMFRHKDNFNFKFITGVPKHRSTDPIRGFVYFLQEMSEMI